MHHVENLNEFNKNVLESDVPVLVDFYTEWCSPCKILDPTLEDLETKIGDRIKIMKVNIDETPEVASQFNIKSIPSLLFFKEGEVQHTLKGVQPLSTLEEELTRLF